MWPTQQGKRTDEVKAGEVLAHGGRGVDECSMHHGYLRKGVPYDLILGTEDLLHGGDHGNRRVGPDEQGDGRRAEQVARRRFNDCPPNPHCLQYHNGVGA